MVVVPAESARARAASSRLQEPVAALVIDSQPLFMDALATILQEPPLSATVTKSTRSDVALDMLRGQHFDVVLCELSAQPLSGLHLVEVLAAELPAIPVILLGDQRNVDGLTEALGSHAAGLFTKDANLDEFLDGVSAVVSGHRAISAQLMKRILERLARRPVASQDGGTRPLSRSEIEILTMVGDAESIASIAASRGVTNKTVRNHLAKIYRKLELHGRTEAMLWAARSGLTSR